MSELFFLVYLNTDAGALQGTEHVPWTSSASDTIAASHVAGSVTATRTIDPDNKMELSVWRIMVRLVLVWDKRTGTRRVRLLSTHQGTLKNVKQERVFRHADTFGQ
ncbi:MAG: hypothetical protein KDB88_13615 [Flavobacteriales bacterium]|nr:hypothetical protein [Flavobacteriales bacterium]